MITKEQFTKVIEDTLKLNKEYDRWDDLALICGNFLLEIL